MLKNNFLNMSTYKKRFTSFSGDKVLAERAKRFPSLYDKGSRSCRESEVVKNTWLEVANKKTKCLEDGRYFQLKIFGSHTNFIP